MMASRNITAAFGRLWIFMLAAAILTACGSSRNSASAYKAKPGGKAVSDVQEVRISASLAPQSKSLLKEANGWLGTPYLYGGNDRKGIDCSALMLRVYADALQIKIPRNSRAQSDYCTPVKKKDLVPGDLLFFATTKGSDRVSHVGMYIGDGKMIHSSASRGVIISDLSADYYTRTFAGAGRVEQYHAMLVRDKTRGGKKTPSPVDVPPLPSAGNPDALPFILEPVASLPAPADRQRQPEITAIEPAPDSGTPAVETAAAPAPRKQAAVKPPRKADEKPAVVPVRASSATGAEPSADIARMSVLDKIIEQKIDSIVAN